MKLLLILFASLGLTQWQMKSSTADDTQWTEVTVPTTVLSALVDKGVYPDPWIGMNNFTIPDVSEPGSPFRDPYQFRTSFTLPAEMAGASHIWLHLDGINYRADINLNGVLIATREQVVGMFRRFRFDITPALKRSGPNELEITVYQTDHPGTPTPGHQWDLFRPNRGNSGDGLFRDETMKMSGGWDCAPVVRDRNMGIWQDVWLSASGDVTVENPFVYSEVPSADRAILHLESTLSNHSVAQVKGTLTARIIPENGKTLTLSKSVSLAPGESRKVSFLPYTLDNPLLWWPNGYGEQHLYKLELSFETGPRKLSDSVSTPFGIREVGSYLMDKDGEKGRVFTVNGVKIFARGGWLQPDAMLRNTDKNIYDQARLLKEAGVNLVGSEDMPAPDPAWLDSWDEAGLMSWHVFHQCYRMYPGRANAHNPDDHELAAKCVRDIILRYRNHPSIIAWFGVNEVMVDEDLYVATKQACKELDPTRPFFPTTATSWDVEKLTPWILEDLPVGTTDDGAPDYNWAPSDYYFRKVNEVHLQMFRNELGMPSMPVYRSLEQFIPSLNKPFDPRDPLFPLDSHWAEHGAWDANNFCYRAYDNAIRTLYSDPVSARDYVRKGQMVSAEGYRAMFEAANHRMWDITTGVMLWKLNSCWPDVCWQFYDWSLTPTAAYYFAKKALEPVHIQMNADTRMISIINTTPTALSGLKAKVSVWGNDMKEHWSMERTLDAPAQTFTELEAIPYLKDITAVALVRMSLEDASGAVVSENFYWYYTQHQNYYWLTTLPKVDLHPKVKVLRKEGDGYRLELTLKNDSQTLSFFNEIVLLSGGTPAGPVFWDDNFVTLFPGETKVLSAWISQSDTRGDFSVEIN